MSDLQEEVAQMISDISAYKAMPEGAEKDEEGSSINYALIDLQGKIYRSGRNDIDSLISSLEAAWGPLPSTPEGSQDGGRRNKKNSKKNSKKSKKSKKAKSKKNRKASKKSRK